MTHSDGTSALLNLTQPETIAAELGHQAAQGLLTEATGYQSWRSKEKIR